jgi:hypothetical protein
VDERMKEKKMDKEKNGESVASIAGGRRSDGGPEWTKEAPEAWRVGFLFPRNSRYQGKTKGNKWFTVRF